MAGALVNVKIDDTEMRDLFDRVMQHMKDMTPVMREIGEIEHESVMRNFQEHRAPDGTPWKPLAESTRRQRAKRGRSDKDILIFNRILMGSLHPQAYPDRMELGTNIVYAAIHQFGGMAGRGHSVKIPERTFLGVRDDDWPEIKATVADYLLAVN